MAVNLHLAAPEAEPEQPQPQAAPIRVLLADDHHTVRRSMRLLLENEDDVEVVAEATDIASVMVELSTRAPHVLALDPRMREWSGIEAIRLLRLQVPDTQIVVLTMEASGVLADHALRAGAIGFVLKDAADCDLADAVRHAMNGLQYVSGRVAAQLEAVRRPVARASLYDAS
jgi:two-component system response regulator NreC